MTCHIALQLLGSTGCVDPRWPDKRKQEEAPSALKLSRYRGINRGFIPRAPKQMLSPHVHLALSLSVPLMDRLSFLLLLMDLD